MISRIVLAVALVLLVAAPAPALDGAVQIEIVEEPAPLADDEAVTTRAAVRATSRLHAAGVTPSEDLAAPGPALTRVFRPPRSPRA